MASEVLISEALMEMHFHRALVKAFADVYGDGFLYLYKPSSRREAWVGFDQAWVRTDVARKDLFETFKGAAAGPSGTTQSGTFYLAYVLQFKVVRQFVRASPPGTLGLPPPGVQPPYLRSEIDLVPNEVSGRSQHETLWRLKQSIPRADVNYACAMVFDSDDIWKEPDLDKLRVVPVDATAPAYVGAYGERHFIVFQNMTSPHVWCSEAKRGEGLSAVDWVHDRGLAAKRQMSGTEVLAFLERAEAGLALPGEIRRPTQPGSDEPPRSDDSRPSVLPPGLMVVQYEVSPTKSGPQGYRA